MRLERYHDRDSPPCSERAAPPLQQPLIPEVNAVEVAMAIAAA